MDYSFDIEHARKYGVDEAIMIKNLQFWIGKNKANGKHLHDGKTWTYNSAEAFVAVFPFWSAKQIRRVLDSLKEQGVLVTGNYNEKGYDRTSWYAFSDESIFLSWLMDFPKWEDGFSQTGAPIPDNKPDILKPDVNTALGARAETISPTDYQKQIYEAWQALPEVPKPPAYVGWIMTQGYRDFLALIRGYHSDDVLGAIKNYGECLADPDRYWPRARLSITAFFKSEVFQVCRPENFPRAALKSSPDEPHKETHAEQIARIREELLAKGAADDV